jgi:hypothetical protein
MTETTSQTTGTATEVRDQGLFARLVGVIFSPRRTFAVVAAHPRWFAMLALVILVTAIVTGGFMFTSTGQQAWLDEMAKRGYNAQQMEGMQRFAPFAGIMTIVGIVVMTPVVVLVISGILLVVFTVGMGGNATFKQLFSVVVHSQVVGLVGGLLKLPINFATGSMSSSTSAAVFFPMLDDTSFLARLVGMLDLFLVWWVVVLAIGCAVLYKRRTGPIAVAFFVLYALIAVAIAAFQAARS